MTTSVARGISKYPRRSVRSLSVQEKVRAIERVHEGESKASVARDIGVPESTLRGWCKGEEKLRGIMARSNCGNSALVKQKNVSRFGRGESKSVINNNTKTVSQKRDFFLIDENFHRNSAIGISKYQKLDNSNDVPTNEIESNQRNLKSPMNVTRNAENESTSRNSYSPTTSTNGESPPGSGANHCDNSNPSPMASSALTNENQLLYNAYANGIIKEIVSNQQTTDKPLDFCTNLSTKLSDSNVNEAFMFWLQSQKKQNSMPMSPLKARTADSSSWFWKLYKKYGVLPQTIFSNQDSNDSSNGHNVAHASDEEDEPPSSAADAARHGEKFLRWLECCSDPSITALQILQFRYLLNRVKKCAEQRRQVQTKTRSRRK